MGVGVKATLVPSTVQGTQLLPDVTLIIDGPGFVAVGAQADFTATVKKASEGTPIPSGDVTWSTYPLDAASVNPKTGLKVSVVPLKKGPFVLTATLDTINSSVAVAAVDPPASEDLPFIGQGFGSLVIAVLVVVAIILLALTGILTGEAVAILFGGLLGYIFGVATSTAATSSKKP
ncbi:MAG: hypothetical protein AUH89_00150 [Ktedonobacter sp. 13_1_40CM_4_52_4]|nr:MAG: hypothetical protein AUH89_00150 [Ktedonobacter sp. 13_1_40CM_4_52_4]